MSNAMSSSQRATAILGSIAVIIAVFSALIWSQLPTTDHPDYFNFADKRTVMGLVHFYDVASNLFFIYISLFSLFAAFKLRYVIEKRIWDAFVVLNLAVFFTGWGSSYFHLFARPVDLIWDRLPMAVGFAALLTLVLVDRVVFYYHRLILLTLTVLGFWSVWKIAHGDGDIRTYLLVQFGSLLAIILVLIFFRKGHVHRGYLWIGLALYALAKVCEIYDHQIFALLGGSLSGHTLKHVLAAIGILSLNVGVLTSNKQLVAS